MAEQFEDLDLDSDDYKISFSQLFKIHKVLGKGAYGTCLWAIDKRTNKHCCVKVRRRKNNENNINFN